MLSVTEEVDGSDLSSRARMLMYRPVKPSPSCCLLDRIYRIRHKRSGSLSFAVFVQEWVARDIVFERLYDDLVT